MSDLTGTFVNESGVTELAGHLHVPGGIDATQINGVSINNTPGGEGLVLSTVNAANCHWAALVTDAAAPPVAYVTPLVFDHTAVTGGLYAWDGAAYVQVGGPI
jgi:hypothetical protein